MIRLVLIALVLSACSTEPRAQEINNLCAQTLMPRAVLTGRLKRSHGEVQQRWVVLDDTTLLELFANPETGTWTAIKTHPRGLSCATAMGQGWTQAEDDRL